ncbi:MAG: hydantoinase B/oxoprolinase family protein [Opitutales bacterium]
MTVEPEQPWRLFVDTGGTFTDCLAIAPDGREVRKKVLSSGHLRARVRSVLDARTLVIDPGWSGPDDFARGFNLHASSDDDSRARVRGFSVESGRLSLDRNLADRPGPGALLSLASGLEAPVLAAHLATGVPAGEPLPRMELRLATTRGTNALLEETGARVLFLVTAGFGDLLRIGDQTRPDLFARNPARPRPLHDRVLEVTGRLDASGREIRSLDIRKLDTALQSLVDDGFTVAAVALMHSDQNPDHERQVGERLHQAGFSTVVLSSDVSAFTRIARRAETALVDAYLAPILTGYLHRVSEALAEGSGIRVMTSAGGLVPRDLYRPKDSLLSGPAGGVVGVAAAGARLGLECLIAFDMGGTSTDVSRYDGRLDLLSSHRVGRARLQAPALRIETVAAGGGSICRYRKGFLEVGPDSAGADPGPACYGAGGPLTLTDVNLLLGRTDPETFNVPVYPEAAKAALEPVLEAFRADREGEAEQEAVLRGFLDVANARMADAIRKISVREGFDPKDYTLVAFGGAGGQHACAIGAELGMERILIPGDAGILSAVGLNHAVLKTVEDGQVLQGADTVQGELSARLATLEQQGRDRLVGSLGPNQELHRLAASAECRLSGQEVTLRIDVDQPETDLAKGFRDRFEQVFGYHPPGDHSVEVVALRVEVGTRLGEPEKEAFGEARTFEQPQVEASAFGTVVIDAGWSRSGGDRGSLLLKRTKRSGHASGSALIRREMLTQRFRVLVEEMGLQLQRTALSTNIRERLDFSCALLDPDARLVLNAPHIPVHLGALGACLRRVLETETVASGDVVVVNHPGFGGSHLPDITVFAPVFGPGDDGSLLGYLATRAHHAELGGKAPGSMPADAACLAEEGVVLSPFKLFDGGKADWEAMAGRLSSGPWPSRRVSENIADLQAQVAALRLGTRSLRDLADRYGADELTDHMTFLRKAARDRLAAWLETRPGFQARAEQRLDDGSTIRLSVAVDANQVCIDFSGTDPVHPGNLNATPAVIRSAVIYVLRVLIGGDLLLNEGLMDPVTLTLPENSFLNPDFSGDPGQAPAVVGGNVEVSQRVVDTLLLAFGEMACSQGTMNNTVFGDDAGGMYETIGGGCGATEDGPGASGIHSHMTNTAITDPEILERRFPVRIERFSLRRESGGAGKHPGGDGLVRHYRFLKAQTLSLLCQHRKEGPYGLKGGLPGAPGEQERIRSDGSREALPGGITLRLDVDDQLILRTPGGGGWGKP